MTTTRTEMKIENVAIDSLHPDPANPRTIGKEEMEALTRSLRQFDFVQPVLARREDSIVIGGHQRLVAARRLGWKTVPVIFLDLTVEQSRLLNLALNKISGEWDQELLARMLAELKPVEDIDLSLSGFTQRSWASSSSLSTCVRRRNAWRPSTSMPRWKPHRRHTLPNVAISGGSGITRLLCGDATDAGDVSRLLGERKAAMAFTDPPYNVGLGDHGGQQRGSRRRRIANDALAPEAWEAFVRAWAQNLLNHVDGALYICMSTKEWPTVSRILEETGAHWSDTIIWEKDRFVLGRADYQRQYEPVWYGWREGASHHWCGDRDQGDVWTIPRPAESELHPTMKPLELVERTIRNSSRPGDAVLDLFLGSGTTVIACERTGRVCFGMELEPAYVDVAIRRWEAFSGEKAEGE